MSGKLTNVERWFLDVLSESRVTRSAVTLASDLWERGALRTQADPSGFCCWVIEALSERGLVTYTLGHHEVPTRIRLTDEGWEAIGFPVLHIEVGHRLDSQSASDVHSWDKTDFRSHKVYAQGGPIERMSIWKHVLVYPDHDHHEALEELGMSTNASNVYQRGTTPGSSWERSRNQKRLILRAIEQLGGKINGEVGNPAINPLHEKLKSMDDTGYLNPHNLAHMLFTMRKDAMVKIKVRSKGSNQEIISIELAPRGKSFLNGTTGMRQGPVENIGHLPTAKATGGKHPVGIDRTDPRTHGSVAEGGPITKEQMASAGAAAMDAVKRAPADYGLPLHQNEKPLPPPVAVISSPTATSPLVEHMGSVIDEWSFPLITKLADRGKQIEQAAALLEAAGQADLAITALDSVKYTELETEVLRLWDAFRKAVAPRALK